MAEKKSMTVQAAKAVARVKAGKSWQGRWGVGEHLACLRYMFEDVLREQSAKLARGKPETDALVNAVQGALKETFKADPELAYASNFQKLLVKAGEVTESNEYE